MKSGDVVQLIVHIVEMSMAPVIDCEPFTLAEARASDYGFIETTAIVAVMPSRRVVVEECAGVNCALCTTRHPIAALAWRDDPFTSTRMLPEEIARDLVRHAVQRLDDSRAERSYLPPGDTSSPDEGDPLPCPFCGAVAKAWGSDMTPPIKMARVACTACHAAGGHYSKRAEAIDAWNHRAVCP